MCPICLTTMALIAASAASTGGMAALVAMRCRAPERRPEWHKINLPHHESKEASS